MTAGEGLPQARRCQARPAHSPNHSGCIQLADTGTTQPEARQRLMVLGLHAEKFAAEIFGDDDLREQQALS